MHLAIKPARKTTASAAVQGRSASLPHEHAHPILTHLDDCIRTLRSWSAGAAGQASGITLVDAVLVALGELLELPKAVAALHNTAAGDRILDWFLMLADAYSTFQSALVTLKQSAAELQVGTRSGDGVMVTASLREHRQTEKELRRMVATMRHSTRSILAVSRPADTTENEVISIVAEVAVATAEASGHLLRVCSNVIRTRAHNSPFKQVADQAERQALRQEGSARDSDGGIGEVGEARRMHRCAGDRERAGFEETAAV